MSDLSNDDITRICHEHRIPLKGIYLKDTIPPGAIQNGFTVFNLDHVHEHGPTGTHWTCAYCSGKGCVYFDSFGFPPSVAVDAFIRRRFKDYYFNNKDIQDYYSERCGLYCLGFGLYASKKGLSGINDYLRSFGKNTKQNEQILKGMGIM